MMKHKWHKEIKAWADGVEIEFRYTNREIHNDTWLQTSTPDWYLDEYEYRIKPQPKEPQYLYVFKSSDGYTDCSLTRTVNTGWHYIGKIKLEEE